MKCQDNFKFLNVQLMKRKKTEENKSGSEFLIINLLDNENNPCRFFVFNEDLFKKVIQNQYVGLQDILVTFELVFVNNNWSVRVLDID